MIWLATLWRERKGLLLVLGATAIAIAVLAVVNHIYGKGEKAGAANVTNAVQLETIRKTEEARKEKGQDDEKVRDKPIDAVIDGLR